MPSRDRSPAPSFSSNEALQLAVEAMPTLISDGKGGRVRPVMGVLVAASSGFCVGLDVGTDAEPAFEVAARVLDKALAALPRTGPFHVEVRDPELATLLSRRDELAGVRFEVVDALDAVDFMLLQMQRELFPSRIESPLDKKGMTVERLRAFADACALFHAAKPWRHLHDDDLIEVASPKAPAGMKCASILGAGGNVTGIGFFPNKGSHERLISAGSPTDEVTRTPRWSLLFHAADELPPEDADLWQRHGLRVTADDAVPMLLRYKAAGKVDRPDGATTTFVEGLCRAIAATTEADIDAGRWTKTVRTFDGEVEFRLTIPHLLARPTAGRGPQALRAKMEASMREVFETIRRSGATSVDDVNAVLDAQVNGTSGAPSTPATPKDRAQALCDEAQGQRSRRQLQMLRQAVGLDPDCADAYVLLARLEADPLAAERLFRQGLDAARRSLGDEPFEVSGYPFWGAVESRPFMRAMEGLASVLVAQQRFEDAVDVWSEMLRLNPGDNQGIRYNLLPALIGLGHLDAARALIEFEDYRDEVCALWDFSAAIVAFKQGRATDAASALQRGTFRNRFVAPMLLDEDRPRGMPDVWSPGTQSEAAMVADLLLNVFAADPSAMQWLRESMAPQPRRKSKRK